MSETAPRATLDVSSLPTCTYGFRSLVWWGTVAFMAIESTTLAMCVGTYLYLRRNFSALPPERIAPPSLLVAGVGVVVMLLSFVPLRLLDRAGARKDMRAVRVWLSVALLFSAVFVLVRWFELQALNVRWDQNAYGSAAWLVLVSHGTLLAVEVGEVAIMTAMAWAGHWEEKHFSDVCDVVMYWYFMVLAWLPLYALVFLLPRVM
jgi:cytochrome c oxidase subunit I+III